MKIVKSVINKIIKKLFRKKIPELWVGGMFPEHINCRCSFNYAPYKSDMSIRELCEELSRQLNALELETPFDCGCMDG